MTWLKKNSSVCILILNGNSCTSLVFGDRYFFLTLASFLHPNFIEYLMILFFQVLSLWSDQTQLVSSSDCVRRLPPSCFVS